jgi:hypothetical protein
MAHYCTPFDMNKNAARSDMSDFIVKMVDVAGKVASVVTPVGASIASFLSWNAYSTAGALANAWAWLMGGAGAAAMVTTKVIGLGASVGVYCSYKLLENWLTNSKRKDILKKLPELVKEILSPCIGEVVEKLAELYDMRIENMRCAIFEQIKAVEEQKKRILEAGKSNDPSIAERMKDDLESVHVLEKRFAELKNLVRAEAPEYE